VTLVFLAAALAVAVVAKGRLDARSRGYSTTHGADVVHYTLASRLLGRDVEEVAVVPRGGGTRPLLVLLHGRHDPASLSWIVPTRTGPESMLNDSLFAGLARLGRRAPVIVLLNGGGHSYYHDRRDGRWGSMILDEAIPDAARRFGTTPGRVAIGGISMGGYGALHLAASRPHAFCAVGGHSAALWQSGGASAPGAFDDAADFARNDVVEAVRKGMLDTSRVWIDVGTADPFRAADTALVDALRRRDVRVTYHLWPGPHAGSYWHAHMAAYLRFYASALATCRAG
jgi:S-formylglutathione hydrolase FrmB